MTRFCEAACMRIFGRHILIVAVVGLLGCSASDDARNPERSSVAADATGVLFDASPGMAVDCENAAAELGFAVPCPRTVPDIAGEPASCLSSCVSTAGADETTARLFFLDVAGFDGPDDLGPVRHLAIEARRVADAPPVPCYDGVASERYDIEGSTVFECPEATAESQGNSLHGEGAHAGHLLATWDASGIRFAISVHGLSAASHEFLQQVHKSIEVVEP